MRITGRLALAAVVVLWAAPTQASVSGHVLAQDGVTPVAGAGVRVQGTSGPVATSAADGSFTLAVSYTGTRTITASIPYVPGAPINRTTSGQLGVADGETSVQILLPLVPSTEGDRLQLQNAEFCGGCHSDQVPQWQASNHADAALDTWVLDLFSGTGTPGGGAGYVYRNLHDPGETGFCATCHAAIEDSVPPGGQVMLDEVTAPAALDGVGCMTCHAVDSVNNNMGGLHHLGNATYRFPSQTPPVPDWTFVWGPLPDVAQAMNNSESAVHDDSRFCGSCHEYVRPDIPTVPGQTTYSEWLASPYAVPGPGFRDCQSCHMPTDTQPGPIVSGGPDRPPEQRHFHTFVGATPATLSSAILLSASGQDIGGQLEVQAQVTNQGAGHSFPSGVSVRNAILVVSATRLGVPLPQSSGPTVPFWADDDVPGQQPGDYAGQPGKGYARILEGRINDTGPVVRPVLFVDAEDVFSDTLLPAGQADTTTLTFAFPPGTQPGDVIDVDVRLLYRRAFRATAVTKGWAQTPQGGPVEIEVASQSFQVTLTTPVELQGLTIQ